MKETERRLFGGDWWRKDGAHRLLHDINPLRLQIVREAAGGLDGKRLLDLGCGGGIFAESAARAGALVKGVDVSAAAIEQARAHAQEQGLQIEYCRRPDSDAVMDKNDIGQFEVVTCFEMIEHLPHPAAAVADVATLLGKRGVAVFSTINRTLKSWSLMIMGLENMLNILPPGAHDYRRFVRPDELARMCTDAGLSVKRVAGLNYSFFGKNYFLDDRHSPVNYFLLARRDDAGRIF